MLENLASNRKRYKKVSDDVFTEAMLFEARGSAQR